MNKLFKSNWFWIIVLSIPIGIAFGIRCYDRELIGDELIYQYVWEADDDTTLWSDDHRFDRKVSSFADIWQTQVKHYMKVNGRSLVHSIEQAFTGHMMAFAIINTAVFLFLILMMVRYVAPRNKQDNFMLWLSIYIMMLVFFPFSESLWVSINYGMNYLWPAMLAVAVLILWDKIIQRKIPHRFNILIGALAFIFGWTHEAFVIGLAGGMFVYYCFHFREFRGQIPVLAIPMWVSAIIMVFSPGNISRFFGDSGSLSSTTMVRLGNGIGYMIESIPIALVLAGALLIVLFGKRAELYAFIKKNDRLFYVFAVSLSFAILVNTHIHSLTFANLVALLIIFRYVCSISYNDSDIKLPAVILAICFISQQALLAYETSVHYDYQHKLIEDFKTDQDGVIIYSSSDVGLLSYPFVRTWDKGGNISKTLSYVYSKLHKDIIVLTDHDSEVLTNPDKFFTDYNKVPGNMPVYHDNNGSYYWFKQDSLTIAPGQIIEAELFPVDWNHDNAGLLFRLKFLLFPEKYESVMKLETDTIETERYGRLVFIKCPAIRKIKAINLIK